MAITIDFLANERGLVRGADNAAEALEEVSDALDDVARDSQRSADKMETEYRNAARGVDQSNERLERSFKELAASSKQSTSKIGDDLDAGTRRGTVAAGKSVEEFSSEAKQNIAETFSSFRGDATDFAQIVQDTLGGLAGSLEGLPAVAAVAAGAAGLGLILGAVEKGTADSAAWKQEVADLTLSMIDAGNTGSASLDTVLDKLRKLATTGDDAGVTLDKLDRLASKSGSSFEDVAQAYAGNTEALEAQVDAGKKRLDQLKQEEPLQVAVGRGRDIANKAQQEAIYNQEALNGYLDQASQKAQEAARNAELYAESGAAGMEAKAEQVRSIDQAYDDAAGAVEDYFNAESGAFDVQKYIDAMTQKAQALDGFRTNMQQAALTLSPEAVQFLQKQGVDAASQLVQSYLKGTADQQQQLNAVWTTAGKTSADSYTGSLVSNLPATVPGPKVVIDDVDTSTIVRSIQTTLNGHRFEVPVYATPRVGNAVR